MPKTIVKRKPTQKTITHKQKIFAAEYIKDFNGTQAAIRAKYSVNSAKEQASRLLTNANVQAEVAKLMQKRVEKVEVDANYVLQRLVEIDQMNLLDIMTDDLAFKPLSEWPDCWLRTVSSIESLEEFANVGGERVSIGMLRKIKLPDKIKNLELLGKYVDVKAWVEKVELDVNLKLSLPEAIKLAREERLLN